MIRFLVKQYSRHSTRPDNIEVVFERKFIKDLEKISYKSVLKRIQAKVEEAEQIVQAHETDKAPEIPGMSKLQGYDHYYRIRVGDYRLGISIEIVSDKMEDIFRFVRCLHRKDVYKQFP